GGMMRGGGEARAPLPPRVNTGSGLVLPPLTDIQRVSKDIAFAVGKMAQQRGGGVKPPAEALLQAIEENFWLPEYRSYRRTSI
ncbi:NAD-dependent malic enzyme, partial [Cronobacter sakazakii]